MSLRRLRLSKGGLTAEQKSAEGIVGHDVGKASLTFAVRGICDREDLCFQQTDHKGLAYNRSMPAGKISGWSWILGGG